ncbi:hypothetical protein [Tenacibaculum ovolyticum]|uniref:hypothetical protein n=1 Tax=Tenacibaculum ovolyticum TaxID=104270 RepID=UPI001F3B77F5|nr:hypothetical protein [Tenacibaculum ovolyticum]
MNALKNLRKPYLSIFLSSLFFFVNCSPSNQIEDKTVLNEISLKNTVRQHIEISKKLASILKGERKINYEILKKSSKKLKSYSELKNVLIQSNIEQFEKTSILLKELQENINILLNYYVNKYNYGELETKKIISNEIDKQLNEISNKLLSRSSSCRQECAHRWYIATKRCERNWYIGNAGAAISGFFTLGTGTLIGVTLVGGVALLCISDARNDVNNCYQKCDGDGKEDDNSNAPIPF